MAERKDLLQVILNTYEIPGVVLSEDVFSKVTAYEVNLAAGCDESSLRKHSKEIALHLGADSISVAKTSRDGVFCIEVLNDGVDLVRIGEVFKSLEFIESDSCLTVALGKDDSGGSIVCDLKKMPHLLIGGDSCAGEVIFPDSIIMSVLRKSSPDEVRMILADLHSGGFSKYNGTPHMACPALTDAKAALSALFYIYSELDGRIASLTTGAGDFPYIIIVINEFSGLMALSKPWLMEIVKAIGRKGKDARIHLVLATRSPDRGVVTEFLKDCIPARVAFRVADAAHSRILLDRTGAETLEDGNMLYSPAYSAKPSKIRSAYVSSAEISRVTEFLINNNNEPVYDKTLMRFIEAGAKAHSPDSVCDQIKENLSGSGLADFTGFHFDDDDDFKDDEELKAKIEDRKKDWDIDW